MTKLQQSENKARQLSGAELAAFRKRYAEFDALLWTVSSKQTSPEPS